MKLPVPAAQVPVPAAPSKTYAVAIRIGLACCAVIALGALLWWRLSPATAPGAETKSASQPLPSPTQTASAKQPAPTPDPSLPKDVALSSRSPALSSAAKPEPRLTAPQKQPAKSTPSAPEPVAQQPSIATPAPEPPSPVPTGRYLGPPTGRFTWTGTLAAGQTLTITVEGASNRPSSGSIDGRGIPYNLAVAVGAQPTEIRVIQKPTASNGRLLILKNTSSSDIRSINVQWREEKE